MSARLIQVPAVLQPRMDTYSARYIDKMAEKNWFTRSIRQVTWKEAVKIVVYRIFTALGALFVNLLDLKEWIFETSDITKMEGKKFHCVNLISILVFPLLALATIPFGCFPQHSLLRGFKGILTPVQYIERYHSVKKVTLETARDAMHHLAANHVKLDEEFLTSLIKENKEIILRSFVLTIPDRNLPESHDERLLQKLFETAFNEKNIPHLRLIVSLLDNQQKNGFSCQDKFLTAILKNDLALATIFIDYEVDLSYLPVCPRGGGYLLSKYSWDYSF